MLVANRIGLKQGHPLSTIDFNLYIDEISYYIERLGGSRECLVRVAMPIILYGDDIILI